MALQKEKEKASLFQSVTLDEFDQIPEDQRHLYELVDGMVMMTPRPSVTHQSIAGALFGHLYPYFAGKTCRVLSEVEVQLENDIFIPDISVLCDPENFTEQRYKGPPAVVIEVLSPATRSYDLFTKLNKYQMAGVKEYWIVDPKSQNITVHHFEISEVDIYIRGETLTTPLFEGLILALDDVFEQ